MESPQPFLDPSKPEAARSRIELTFGRVTEGWSRESTRGVQFKRSFVDFFNRPMSRATARNYAYAIAEFFEWFELSRGRVPLPDQIRRADAGAYYDWLRTRKVGLGEFRLERDPQRRLDLAIYQAVHAEPGARIDAIRSALRMHGELTTYRDGERVLTVDLEEGGLGHRLSCLAHRKTLLRQPSIEQIRSGEVDVGLEHPDRAGIAYEVPPDVFQYWVPADERPLDAARSSGNATRLASLTSLWGHWLQSGENDGSEQLLRVNIWQDSLRAAKKQAKSHTAAGRARKTPDLVLFLRLLAGTYVRSHGEGALLAAKACFEGAPVPKGTKPPRYSDVRDRAMLMAFSQLGVRVSELVQLKRSSITGDPPVITVVGKGGVTRSFRVPAPAFEALRELTRKLVWLAQKRVGGTVEAASDPLLQHDAPLIPSVASWGKNARKPRLGLTRFAVAMALRRLAPRAGITKGSQEFERIHPHGFRHLFAHLTAESGTMPHITQAMLGHASLAMTGVYTEERRPEELLSRAFEAAKATPAAPAGPEPPERPLAPPEEPSEPPSAPPPSGPALPTGGGLVAVGAPPAIEPEREALARLAGIYDERWGEQGDRYRLVSTRAGTGAKERAKQKLLRMAEEVVDVIGVEAASVDKLNQMFAGNESGLVWWAGYGGDLRPELPVMSPDQSSECNAFVDATVCKGLSDLWSSWVSGEGRGPTGAKALVKWLAEALDAAGQVQAHAKRTDAAWVPFWASWDDTVGHKHKVFREHEPSEVVRWFEARAWQHAVGLETRGLGGGAGRTPRVVGAMLKIPDYYAASDPVAELPWDERQELLDWLSALTGLAAHDTRPILGGHSRAAVGEFLTLLCSYQLQVDESYDKDKKAHERAQARAVADDLRGRIDAFAQRLTGRAFDVKAASTERRKSRTGEKTREGRAKRHLAFVEQVFGKDAATDIAIHYLARCEPPESKSARGKPPLSEYRDLFRVDRALGTIVHDPAFAKEFALKTGMHSECVGRRLARDLWELRKRSTAGEKVRAMERDDALVALVADLASYRVPCPRALEMELRERLDFPQQPYPVYEVWSRQGRKEGSALTELAEAIAGEFEEMSFADFGAAEAFQREVFTPNARRALPNPVQLLFALLA